MRLILKQAVNSFSFPTGSLRQPLGGPAGWSSQQNLFRPALKNINYGSNNGGFAGTRATGDDENPFLQAAFDCFFLER